VILATLSSFSINCHKEAYRLVDSFSHYSVLGLKRSFSLETEGQAEGKFCDHMNSNPRVSCHAVIPMVLIVAFNRGY
jgi:hypothetical protein